MENIIDSREIRSVVIHNHGPSSVYEIQDCQRLVLASGPRASEQANHDSAVNVLRFWQNQSDHPIMLCSVNWDLVKQISLLRRMTK